MLYNAKLLTEAVRRRVSRSLPPLPAWLETHAEALWTKQAERARFPSSTGRVPWLRDWASRQMEAVTADGKMSQTSTSASARPRLGRAGVRRALALLREPHDGRRAPVAQRRADALLGAGAVVVSVPWDEWAREDQASRRRGSANARRRGSPSSGRLLLLLLLRATADRRDRVR